MQTLFRSTFIQVMPLEQLDTACECISLLSEVGFTSPFEPLQEIMELGTSHIDVNTVLSQVNFVIDDAMNLLLQGYGVEVTESTPLTFKLKLSRLLADLEDYYLPYECLAIIDGTYDPSAILAEILELTQEVTAEEALEYLLTVQDKLIERMGVVLRAKQALLEAQTDTAPSPIDKSRIQLLNRLLKSPQASSYSAVRELVEAGVRVGQADAHALVNQHIEVLTLISPEQLTHEVMGLVIFSNTPSNERLSVAREIVGEFTDLMSDLRVADRVLNELRLNYGVSG